jgi:hypothetical protein
MEGGMIAVKRAGRHGRVAKTENRAARIPGRAVGDGAISERERGKMIEDGPAGAIGLVVAQGAPGQGEFRPAGVVDGAARPAGLVATDSAIR